MTTIIKVHFPYKLLYYSYINVLSLHTQNTILPLKYFLRCQFTTIPQVKSYTMLELMMGPNAVLTYHALHTSMTKSSSIHHP